MKNLRHIIILLFAGSTLINCEKDNSIHRIHIEQPTSHDKHLGDVIQIKIEFETLTGPVEHISIKIIDAARTIAVYDEPLDPHPPSNEGVYLFEDEFILSEANGITVGAWILEAKIYSAENGTDTVWKQVAFNVVP